MHERHASCFSWSRPCGPHPARGNHALAESYPVHRDGGRHSCGLVRRMADVRARAEPARHDQRRRQRQPPPDQSRHLRRRARDDGPVERLEQPAQPERRQQHDPVQLAGERRQPRQRLVFPEHRRQQRHCRRAWGYVLQRIAGGQCQSDADHSHDRMGRQARRRPAASSQAFRSRSTGRRPAATGSGFPTRATVSGPTASS